jgi:lipopolysaccharide exporter
MRWSDRLIGIASTLILARLLIPADFGIVAMASLVVALVDTLLDLGVNSALVQNAHADRHDFDTAWTLRLGQAVLAALLIAQFGAPLAADYFNDGRVEDVLRVMAISMVIGGFENIGIVAFQKNMEFGRDFQFFFQRRIVGFTVTVTLAFWLRSYWAMVFGALIGRIAGVWFSYILHDFRPRFSLARLKQLWSFSQWILVRNLGTYGAQQLDKLLVGRRSHAATLGTYSLADDISAMPTGELLAPLGRVLFPAFVQAAKDPVQLRKTFSLALGIQAMVAIPAGVGLALVAHTAVPLLLGAQWVSSIPIVQTLALMNVAVALTHSSHYLLLTLGKVKLQAIFSWLQLLLLAGFALAVFPDSGAKGIAQIRLGVSVLAMMIFLALVLKAVPELRWRNLLVYTWRPFVATCVMAGTLTTLMPDLQWPHAVQLGVEIVIGGVSYVFTILSLWYVTGRQEGAESYLLEKVLQGRFSS